MAADCSRSPAPSSPAIPWAQVVRGGDSEANATPRSPDHSVLAGKSASLENENKSQHEASTPTVIGGEVSWPALSECTRSNSSKASVSSQGPPVIQQSSQKQPSQKQDNNNSHSNSKHTSLGRQRSMKHRTGGTVGAAPTQGGFSRPPPPPPMPPPFPLFEMPYGNLIPAVMDPSIGGATRATGGVVQFPLNGANHSSQSNNISRRESSGSRPHGDWTYNQGNRQNQDRRNGHVPYQFIPRPGGFIPPPPPPGSPPFISPPVRSSLGCPIGFDGATPFMYVPTLQGMPLPPPPPLLYPMDPNLPTSLLKQIDYYFSDANLVQDHFLRSKMDADGWVSIHLIASFRRVRMLTNNTRFILECLKASKVVEVQGERIRRRGDWRKWINPSVSGTESGSPAAITSTDNAIEATLERVSLAESESATNTNSDGEFVGVSKGLGDHSEHLIAEGQVLPS